MEGAEIRLVKVLLGYLCVLFGSLVREFQVYSIYSKTSAFLNLQIRLNYHALSKRSGTFFPSHFNIAKLPFVANDIV
jgi:hypothetical protein